MYWNDAVRAAGLRPRKRNVSVEDRELLEDWGRHARRTGAMPTVHGYSRKGKYEPSTLQCRFGAWSKVPEAFRKFANGKPEWADVVALLPVCSGKRASELNWDSALSTSPSQVQHARRLEDRATFGNPISFDGLRHEPVNEQGVVLLFGMLAKQLGFLVEAVQTGFPGCEAKRLIGPGQWQRVNIEFEFESRNFRVHGHPLNGCDVIVCWRHNWEDCPKHIDVVELSRVVKPLANSEE